MKRNVAKRVPCYIRRVYNARVAVISAVNRFPNVANISKRNDENSFHSTFPRFVSLARTVICSRRLEFKGNRFSVLLCFRAFPPVYDDAQKLEARVTVICC